MSGFVSVDLVFQVANSVALAAWLLLIFAPSLALTQRLVQSGIVSLVLAGGYWIAIAAFVLASPPPGAGFGSFAGVRALFSSDWGLLAGWIHFLAFDLLVGTWVQARFTSRSFALRAPLLILTFMLGPVGWSLAYIMSRSQTEVKV